MTESADKKVEAHPIIYNKSLKIYADRYKKEEAWRDISYILNIDVQICKDRWKNLRDTFTKYYKRNKCVPSGSGSSTKKQWIFYEMMGFLIPFIEVPRTVGNFQYGKENTDLLNYAEDDDPTNETPLPSYSEANEEPHVEPTPTKKKRTRKEDTECDKFLATLSQIHAPPDSPPLKKFFCSLASRASSWSRRKQSILEMRTLQLFHAIEFEDEP